jgi:archaemetzincin
MIILFPIGEINKSILESLDRPIVDTFNQTVQIGTSMELKRESWDRERKQYQADSILDSILNPLPQDRYLGILDVDIFAFGLNFVFGEADSSLKKALISLKRLKQEFYGLPNDSDLFRTRTIVEAVHELGHTYGLKHCPNPTCVMHFSNSIQDTDKKGWKFCLICQNKLNAKK